MSTPDEGNPLLNLFQAEVAPDDQRSPLWKLFENPDSGPIQTEVEDSPNCAVAFDKHKVFWALRDIPVEEAVKSFLICGAPGSGKTKGIQLFLQSIAPRFTSAHDKPEQLVIFDAKGDALPMLASMDLRPEMDNFYILNPFDSRCAVWNLGEAVQEPGMTRALAMLLIPDDKNSNAPYFAQSAQEIVNAVILGLNHVAGSHWTLRDLLCAVDSADHIKSVTAGFGPARTKVHPYLSDDKHFPGVLSTIASKVGRFDAVAALWHKNSKGSPFSVEKFLSNPGVLVLGNDPVLRESIWPINAVILKALTNAILRQPDTFAPRHWFILDEFRAMERVDCIHDLLNRGRSKGASVTLGIQTVEGITAIYDENGANDLLGTCAHKTFLRAGSFKTAEWAERHFSKVRQMEASYSQGNGHSSINHALHERFLFLASTFLDLSFPGSGKNYESISDVPSIGETIFSTRPFDEVLSWCRSAGAVPANHSFDDKGAHLLNPWGPDEEARFCAPQKQKQKQKEKEEPQRLALAPRLPRETPKPDIKSNEPSQVTQSNNVETKSADEIVAASKPQNPSIGLNDMPSVDDLRKRS